MVHGFILKHWFLQPKLCVHAESALELTNALQAYTFCGFSGPWFHFKALVFAT